MCNSRVPPLRGEEAREAAQWLAELRRRLERLEERMPEEFYSVPFECWMEQFLNLRQQIDLLEQMLRK